MWNLYQLSRHRYSVICMLQKSFREAKRKTASTVPPLQLLGEEDLAVSTQVQGEFCNQATSPTMPNDPTIIPSCQSPPPRSMTYSGMSVNIAIIPQSLNTAT